jgi:hypothetical protein
MGISLEKHLRIYNDDCGSYIEIRPDSDGLGLLELNHVEDGGTTKKTIRRGFTLSYKEALLLIDALKDATTNNPHLDVDA